jgi:hypothetical protein
VPYLSQRLAYADMIKTGSNWTSRVILRRAQLPRSFGDGHLPAWWVREQLGEDKAAVNVISQRQRHGRLVFGTVRSPLSWYGSIYRHVINRGGDATALRQMGRGSMEFAPWLKGALKAGDHWPANPFAFAQVHPAGLQPEPGESLWTWATRYFYATQDGERWAVDALVPMEHLQDGLAALGLVETILGRKNEGHGPMVTLTASQRVAILKADGPLMSALGYDADGIKWHILPTLSGQASEDVDPAALPALWRLAA